MTAICEQCKAADVPVDPPEWFTWPGKGARSRKGAKRFRTGTEWEATEWGPKSNTHSIAPTSAASAWRRGGSTWKPTAKGAGRRANDTELWQLKNRLKDLEAANSTDKAQERVQLEEGTVEQRLETLEENQRRLMKRVRALEDPAAQQASSPEAGGGEEMHGDSAGAEPEADYGT